MVPYPNTARGCDNNGQRPNGDIADETVNLVSHEGIEAVTDPFTAAESAHTAWWDTTISEIGDGCNKVFGQAIGGKGPKRYNQAIGSGHYYIQEEWSNRQGGCVQRPPATGVQPPIAAIAASASETSTKTLVTFDASGSSTPTKLFVSYLWEFGDGTIESGLSVSHIYQTPGSYVVRLVVTDSDGLIGTTTQSLTITSASSAITALGSGAFHSCAALADGSVGCWGRNDFGQLGDGTVTCSGCANPGPLLAGKISATEITGGVSHTCALVNGGTIDCWGGNTYGQTGLGAGEEGLSPTSIKSLSNVSAVSAGAFHTCALMSDSTIRCWGNNQYGQLGNGTVSCATCSNPTPVQASKITTAIAIAAGAGSYDTCTLLADHSVECWGENTHGQLGNGTTTDSSTPTAVSGIANALSIGVGASHACAVLTTGAVECWGNNEHGQLGNGTTTDSSTPTAVSGITDAIAVVAGYQHTCALRVGGLVSCWGNDSRGQLGDGNLGSQSTTPVLVTGLSGAVSQLAANGYNTCAVLSDGSAACWGRNDFGQLGDGNTIDSAVPVAVGPIP